MLAGGGAGPWCEAAGPRQPPPPGPGLSTGRGTRDGPRTLIITNNVQLIYVSMMKYNP